MVSLPLLPPGSKNALVTYLDSLEIHQDVSDEPSHRFLHLARPSCGLSANFWCTLSKLAASITFQSSFEHVEQLHAQRRNKADQAVQSLSCTCPHDTQTKKTFMEVFTTDEKLGKESKKDFSRVRWITHPFLVWVTYPTFFDLLNRTAIKDFMPNLPEWLTWSVSENVPPRIAGIWDTSEDFIGFLRLTAICFIQISFVRYLFSRPTYSNTLLERNNLKEKATYLKSELKDPKCNYPVVTLCKITQMARKFFRQVVQFFNKINYQIVNTSFQFIERLKQTEAFKRLAQAASKN